MTKIKWFVLLFLISLYSIAQYNHPRFEQLLNEQHPEGNTRVHSIEVWHDKESGQEFTCVNNDGLHEQPLSCFATGRNWK